MTSRMISILTAVAALSMSSAAIAQEARPTDGEGPTRPPEGFAAQQQIPAAAEPGSEQAYTDGDPVPTGYHVETRRRRGLVTAGAVTLGTGYLAAIAFLAVDGRVGGAAVVPVLGPFISAATTDLSDAAPIMVADGIVQLAGATMLTIGIFATRKVLLPGAAGTDAFVPQFVKNATIAVAPIHNGWALGAGGIF